jgi:hypothetical protein
MAVREGLLTQRLEGARPHGSHRPERVKRSEEDGMMQ